MKRTGTGRRKMIVLEAIPFDDWISNAEIVKKTGMSPQAVGVIINRSLIPVYVEKKDIGVTTTRTFIYKRRPVNFEPKRLRD
ncbi:unnamed protein product [marine sediment metagenome]|uniref:Uncharacterized protein n=1 Tax=marine sediment metagenome TaxID=412755 RepID=X1JNN9_9ZZZZ